MSEDIKQKLKSYKFWISASSALFLVCEAVLKIFGVTISEDSFMTVINAVLGVFVLLGIVSVPKKSEKTDEENNESQNENTK